MITSLTNARIKNIVALRARKNREKTGLTIVEGIREVTRAIKAGVVIEEFYFCSDLLNDFKNDDSNIPKKTNASDAMIKKLSSKVSIYETTKSVFSKIAYGDRLEGVLAVCKPQALSLENIPSKADSLFVIVESVEKPGNLGAILRTCDGAGVDGVLICDGKTDIYNPNVIRSSLGTVFSINIGISSNEEAHWHIFD